MQLQCLQDTQVTGFNDRGGLRVRADKSQSFNLTRGYLLSNMDPLRLCWIQAHPRRQDATGFVYVRRIGPSVVKHGFGQPFIRKVFQQGVHESERGRQRDHTAPNVVFFETPNQWRGVGHSLQLTLRIRQVESRQ